MITRHLEQVGFQLHQNIKREINTGGLVILAFGQKTWACWEIFFTRAQVVVTGTVVRESRQRKRRVPTVPTLSGAVLGQYRKVLGQAVLRQAVLVQAVLGQAVLRQAVLGQWSWDRQSWDRQSWNRQSWDRQSLDRQSWDRQSWDRQSWDRQS